MCFASCIDRISILLHEKQGIEDQKYRDSFILSEKENIKGCVVFIFGLKPIL